MQSMNAAMLTLRACRRCARGALCHRCRSIHGGDSHCLSCGYVATKLSQEVQQEVADARGKKRLQWETALKVEDYDLQVEQQAAG